VTPLSFVARKLWTGYWHFMRHYHRFEVHGLENVLRIRGPAMLAGYHGKPGARDLIMLQVLLLREYGEMSRAIVHDAAFMLPGLREMGDGMLLIDRDKASLAAAVSRGEKLVVTPGGIAEAWGSFRQRNRVRWSGYGYLKLAAQHRLPVLPVAAVGVDHAFLGLYDAYRVWKPVWKRFHLPAATGVWIGVGPFGVWPFTPPFPVRIVQYVGAPIDLVAEGVKEDDEAGLARVHERVVATVQQMLDRGRDRARGRAAPDPVEAVRWIDQGMN
jgi:1-acyl-sn-glycerol-3-phosphate acyltransferase